MNEYDIEHKSTDDIKKKAEEYLAQNRVEYIKKTMASIVSEVVNDEYDYLKLFADDIITKTASERAIKFLDAVISGDVKKFKLLIKCNDKTSGRNREIGYDAGKPWASVIRGNISLAENLKFRQELCEQFRETIQNERILDLESIVDGLKAQIIELEKHFEEVGEL